MRAQPGHQLSSRALCDLGCHTVCTVMRHQTAEKVPILSSKAHGHPWCLGLVCRALPRGIPTPPTPPRPLPPRPPGWRNSPWPGSHLGPRTATHVCGSRSLCKRRRPGLSALPGCRGRKAAAPQKTIPLNKQCRAPTNRNEVWFKCWHTHKILMKITCMINNIGIQGTGSSKITVGNYVSVC